ncbi:hypothetical protein C8R44DRAFT_774091 [Mycena epipterygia]|nr:hypothetical protein C8R44DRAFT_774091 [Mycena epipterygia]
MLSELDLGLGALEIGVLLSSTLWGVTTVQLYIYSTTPNNDPWWTKTLVYLVYIMESLHTIFSWMYIYRLTVTFYGVPAELGVVQWTLSASSLFDGLIGAIVQMFFAYRIQQFSKMWAITLVSWLGSFAIKFGWMITASLSINLIVDIINTAALSFYLQRGRTGFKQSDQILVKLVMWTVETGLVTAVAAAVQLILVPLWIGISLFYAKLYSNSFLAILNSRTVIRRGLENTMHSSSGGARPWNDMQTGVHVTVVRGEEVDVELARVKHQHMNQNDPDKRPSDF